MTPTKFSSPETYTPKHLAEKILTSKSALEGERKQVTVLFADMKGSMELLADRDPEEARKLLDPVIEQMMEAVYRYEGTVSNLMGDGIMALFGAPLAHEDHAVRACYAALRMQESVKRYADAVRRTEGVPIQIRVGLNSGEVVVGAIGNDLKMDYTAIGQTVHLAARMEQMATPGSVLLTLDALRLAEGYLQVKSLGPVAVKGMGGPLEVYEVTGAGSVRSRLQAAAARGLTRFVGRTAEFETLCQALERAGGGRGQVVALVGEPGVGKSRLFWEFTHSRRTTDWLILESSSVSYGKATAYLPVIDLLKAYFKIQDRDDQRELREKVTGKLLTLDKSLESTLPAFLALLDAPVDDSTWQALDPFQRRQQILGAVKRLLLRESQVQPLVLLFEDLHWIDFETQAMLESLVESLPTSRLLLLVNYRPEYQHGWANKTYYTQLRLDPLPPESAGEILDSVLGNDNGLQSFKRLLIERTEGNPFFLEESVRTLVETKVLVGERGNYHLEKKLESPQVPDTVQAVLAARIDRLPPDEKRMLQSAAVIGKDVPLVLLQAIAEQSEEEISRGLIRLQAAEFLYETSLFPDPEYTFKHALTHEVAYGSLLQDRRRALHARIVDAIEKQFSDRLGEHIERLAHHACRGELSEKAVEYLYQAGKKTAARSANREAIAYFEQALDLSKQLPETRKTLEQIIDIRTDLGPALIATSGYGADTVEKVYTQARELCQRLGETHRLFPVLWGLCRFYDARGELKKAHELGDQLFSVAQNLNDPALLLEAHHTRWSTSFILGELDSVEHHSQCGLSLYDPQQHFHLALRYGGHDSGVCGRQMRAKALWLLGYPDQALQSIRGALVLARDLAHPFSLALALLFGAWVSQQRGDEQDAREHVEAAIALGTGHEFPRFVTQGSILGGYLLIRQQQRDKGVELIRNALLAQGLRGPEREQSYFDSLVGEAYGIIGHTEEGLTMMGETLARVQTTGERFYEAELHRIKGQLLLRQITTDEREAAACFQNALKVARSQSAKSLELRAAMSLSRLWQRQGKTAEARQLLAEIYGWFTEGLDTADLKDAKALLKELA
jgi:class 3 adenylate cyclase/predicted ATPase